jgi:phosphoglycerate dehydrogenase-like enzyme
VKISELTNLGFNCLQDQFVDAELAGGYTSDLLSDVMANLKEGQALITLQAHKNTIAVASLSEAAAVIFCHGRTVAPDVIEAAASEGIALFTTPDNQFDATVKLALALRA